MWSEDILELVKNMEGFEAKAKPCPAGVLTIGYGHTTSAGPPAVKRGKTITAVEADSLLRMDLGRCLQNILPLLPVLREAEIEALCSFVFNVGESAFEGSTLLRRIRAGCGPKAVREAFCMWVKYTDPLTGERLTAGGLVRRRRAEAAFFLQDEDWRQYKV